MSSIQVVLPHRAPSIVGPGLRAMAALRGRVLRRARAVSMDRWFGAFFTLAYLAFLVILFTDRSSVPIAGR